MDVDRSNGGGTDGEGDETGPIPQENLQERVSVGIGEWKGMDGRWEKERRSKSSSWLQEPSLS